MACESGAEAEMEIDGEASQEPRPVKQAKHDECTCAASPFARECIVKVYSAQQREAIKLCDVIEIVGILDREASDSAESAAAAAAQPCIHALTTRKLPASSPALFAPSAAAASVPSLADRSELLAFISHAIGSDRVAAEMLLAHMVSRIHHRAQTQVGKFSLNLIGVPMGSDLPVRIRELFALLLPRSVSFCMTGDSLCNQQLTPKMDPKTDRLTQALLQAANGTFLLIDESNMAPCQLSESGVRAVQSLQNLITDQSVEYGYEVYTLNMHTDMPVLIMGDTKSIFQTDTRVKLAPKSPVPNSLPAVDEAQLWRWRRYLHTAMYTDVEIEADTVQAISQQYVTLRNKTPSLNADMLSYWLTLSRLIAQTFLEVRLSADRWSYARALDMARSDRMATSNSNAAAAVPKSAPAV